MDFKCIKVKVNSIISKVKKTFGIVSSYYEIVNRHSHNVLLYGNIGQPKLTTDGTQPRKKINLSHIHRQNIRMLNEQ